MRRAVFAWLAAGLAAAVYFAFLLTHNLLALELHEAVLRLLPLILLAVPALLFENKGRVRWSLPCGVVALVALVGCVEAMAVNGKLVELMHLDSLVTASRQPYLAFTVGGLFLLGAMFVMERTRSLTMHAGARLLRVLVPVQLVLSLHANAVRNGALRDLLLYVAVAGALLVLGRVRSRHTFFLAGLSGLVLAAYLVVALGLASIVGFALTLAVGGLTATFGIYVQSVRSRREGPM